MVMGTGCRSQGVHIRSRPGLEWARVVRPRPRLCANVLTELASRHDWSFHLRLPRAGIRDRANRLWARVAMVLEAFRQFPDTSPMNHWWWGPVGPLCSGLHEDGAMPCTGQRLSGYQTSRPSSSGSCARRLPTAPMRMIADLFQPGRSGDCLGFVAQSVLNTIEAYEHSRPDGHGPRGSTAGAHRGCSLVVGQTCRLGPSPLPYQVCSLRGEPQLSPWPMVASGTRSDYQRGMSGTCSTWRAAQKAGACRGRHCRRPRNSTAISVSIGPRATMEQALAEPGMRTPPTRWGSDDYWRVAYRTSSAMAEFSDPAVNRNVPLRRQSGMSRGRVSKSCRSKCEAGMRESQTS